MILYIIFRAFFFAKEPSINTDSNAFIENGFRNWKKALKSCDDLMKQSQHIDRLLHKQTSEEIEKNRIRLGASLDCIRWLTFQGCAYKGHDESQSSSNRGYDAASNMRGEWNSLQALFLKDSPQAYYVHCFAHMLQLALVAASREVLQIHEYFTQLSSIVAI
ncbi:hypothetical protein S245_057462, partial [Arachis hypogaea]